MKTDKVKKVRVSFQTSQKLNGTVFLLPWIIGFLLFFLVPIINTIIYSFNTVGVADTGGMTLSFSGIKNYVDLFQTEISSTGQQFIRVFADENSNIFINTPLIVIFSLFCALLVNMNYKGQGVVRVIFFLPIILGLQIVTRLTMESSAGDITGIVSQTTQEGSFLITLLTSNSFLPRESISFIMGIVSNIFSIISKAGVQTLIYLAGLQSINPSLYEVAKIEGATGYEVFWKITFPMLGNITIFAFVYSFVDLFLASSIANEIYNFAFNRNNIGVGSALSVVYMVNVLLALAIMLSILAKVVKLDYGSK